jgi:hypothetical protein
VSIIRIRYSVFQINRIIGNTILVIEALTSIPSFSRPAKRFLDTDTRPPRGFDFLIWRSTLGLAGGYYRPLISATAGLTRPLRDRELLAQPRLSFSNRP